MCEGQTLMVRELFALAEKAQKQQTKPPGHGKKQQWYFFFVSTYWVYFRWGTHAPPPAECFAPQLPSVLLRAVKLWVSVER